MSAPTAPATARVAVAAPALGEERAPDPGAGRFDLVLRTVWTALATNACLALACLPALAVAATVAAARDVAGLWLVALASVCCGPAVAGAFGVFRSGFGGAVWRPFWRAWRAGGRRAAGLWALAAGTVAVLAVDVAAVGLRPGAAGGAGPAALLLLPLFAVCGLVVVAALPVALALAAARPELRVVVVLRVAAVCAVRRWYLTVPGVAVLVVALLAVGVRPMPAVAIVPAPALYVAWANARAALRPFLDAGPPAGSPRR